MGLPLILGNSMDGIGMAILIVFILGVATLTLLIASVITVIMGYQKKRKTAFKVFAVILTLLNFLLLTTLHYINRPIPPPSQFNLYITTGEVMILVNIIALFMMFGKQKVFGGDHDSAR